MASRSERERLRQQMEARKNKLPPQPRQGTIFADDELVKTVPVKEVKAPAKEEKADIVKMPEVSEVREEKKASVPHPVKEVQPKKEKKASVPKKAVSVSESVSPSKWIEKMKDILPLYEGDKIAVRVVGSEEDIMFWKKMARKKGITQQELLAMFMLDLIKDVEDGTVTDESEDILPYQKTLRDMGTPVTAFLPKKLIEKMKGAAAELCLKQSGFYACALMRARKKGVL